VDQSSLDLAGDPSPFRLRELNGFDEQSVRGVDTATAIALLDRLLEHAPGSSAEDLKAIRLTASQRDRLLAAVYERTFGPRIDSTVRCTGCGQLVDATFHIEDLLAVFSPADSSPAADLQPDGTFLLPNGLRFRLPTGEDEMAVAGLSPEDAERELLARCLIERTSGVDLAAVQEAMEEIAPVLALDLPGRCPECGAKQSVHFDMQFYLLRALELERKQIAREVHRLAIAYGWSLTEILGLFRSQRRAFVELIEADFSARARRP
jgi:hypothetical protein